MFYDRFTAGEQLAKSLTKYKNKGAIVLCIPRGGVAVASPIAKALKAKLDVLVVRKLPIPWNPEAGFGAIAPDGSVSLNVEAIAQLGLDERQIKSISQEVLAEVKRRVKKYRQEKPFPNIKGKIVILVDDGLATGYTMIAAIKSIKKQKPKRIVVAIPVSSGMAYEQVKPLADEFVCLLIEMVGVFAIGAYYQHFSDLKDEEVLEYLK